MTTPRHLVWDWNGTLLDDLALTLAAANAVLGWLGHPPIDAATFQAHNTRPPRLAYERLLGRTIGPDEWADAERVFHDAYTAAVARPRLADGAIEALERAAAAGWTQSLLSLTHHDALVPLVEGHGLAGLFTRVDGRLLVADAPMDGDLKAVPLRRHLEGLGRGGAEVVLVGDSLDDLTAARAVGAACVLYAGGSHDLDALRGTGVPVARTLTEAVDLATDAAVGR